MVQLQVLGLSNLENEIKIRVLLSCVGENDFIRKNMSLLVPADTVSMRIVCSNVTVIEDFIVEDAEDFAVELSTTDTAVILLRSNASIRIIDQSGNPI